jgi:hypothetical protein
LFDALGMMPGDELDDLFPGTGIVSRAWAELGAFNPDCRREFAALASRGSGDDGKLKRKPVELAGDDDGRGDGRGARGIEGGMSSPSPLPVYAGKLRGALG